MNSNNKIYSFFIALALLFWNPLSYHLIYANAAIFSGKVNYILYLIYSVIFISGILSMYLVQINKLSDKTQNIIFTIAFTGILFSSLVFIDSLIGLTSKTNTKAEVGLIFEPNSKARYQTKEFDYIVDINSLGLRDREINIDKGDKFRILCFGDSWTFGWGVNIENSWPKKLEQYLKNQWI